MPESMKSTMFWAFITAITYAFILALVSYVHPGTDTARQMINQTAGSLITGALGFFAGRASIRDTTAVTANPTSVTTTKTEQ